MGKIAFSKLNAKVNQGVQEITINDQIIEVKQYIPFTEKVAIVENIVNLALNNDIHYYNPAQVEVFELYYIIEAYTNITFTDKQKQDVVKLYDIFVSTGIAKKIIELLPDEELNTIEQLLTTSLNNVYSYNNSIYNVIANLSNQYDGLNVDVQNIVDNLLENADKVNDLKELVTEVSLGERD